MSRLMIIFVVTLLCSRPLTTAQVTYTGTTVADAFLATGSANNPAGTDLKGLNFGGAGTLVIAPASSAKGEFKSVIRFNQSGATNLFNGTYGTTNWTITGISLELTSNYGTSNMQPDNLMFPVISSGKFVIEWLSNDNWAEGMGRPNQPTTDGVTYNSLSDLQTNAHEILGTNTYTPPGNNVSLAYTLPLNTNLVADVAGGGGVSFLFYAADDQIGYLFNPHTFAGNEPLIHITAFPLLKILSCSLTNGGFHLTGLGATNMLYQVQATTNPATGDWQTLGTITAGHTGGIEFTDAATMGTPQRYYRLAR